jgi:hypothetical protein
MGTTPFALTDRNNHGLATEVPNFLSAERNSPKFASRTLMLLKVSRRLKTVRSLSPACAFPLSATLLTGEDDDGWIRESDIFLLSEVDGFIVPSLFFTVCEQIHNASHGGKILTTQTDIIRTALSGGLAAAASQ